MKKFYKRIFSIENIGISNCYKEKIINILGLSIKIPIYGKLKPLNDFYIELPEVYLSVVAIAKNEAPYIKEWIEYHKLVGVERFYFYDNGSTDNTREILDPYIKEGSVIYNYCEGKCLQNLAYADAIYKYKNQTRWLAIIDLDEYIVPVEKNTIPDFLKDYEKYSGIGVNWVMFDSNGFKVKPSANGGLITCNYTRVSKNYNIKENCHIKSIVNPKKVKVVFHPHFCIFENKGFTVDENFKRVKDCFTAANSSKKIRINHYYSKSEEEYIKKTARGNADNANKRIFNEGYLNFAETTDDYVIQKFVPELKKRMNIEDNEELI
uniref:glycosyltransferase family 92 protein n=1 Tax=Candidatus Stercorousia sp. TaxID=3048886 RepID=UPI0040250977